MNSQIFAAAHVSVWVRGGMYVRKREMEGETDCVCVFVCFLYVRDCERRVGSYSFFWNFFLEMNTQIPAAAGVCVCVCWVLCLRSCVWVCVFEFVCAFVCFRLRMFVCVCLGKCVCVFVCMHVCMCVCVCVYLRV